MQIYSLKIFNIHCFIFYELCPILFKVLIIYNKKRNVSTYNVIFLRVRAAIFFVEKQ